MLQIVMGDNIDITILSIGIARYDTRYKHAIIDN